MHARLLNHIDIHCRQYSNGVKLLQYFLTEVHFHLFGFTYFIFTALK